MTFILENIITVSSVINISRYNTEDSLCVSVPLVLTAVMLQCISLKKILDLHYYYPSCHPYKGFIIYHNTNVLLFNANIYIVPLKKQCFVYYNFWIHLLFHYFSYCYMLLLACINCQLSLVKCLATHSPFVCNYHMVKVSQILFR